MTGGISEAMMAVIRCLITIRGIAYKFDDLGYPEIATKIRELCDLVEKTFRAEEAKGGV